MVFRYAKCSKYQATSFIPESSIEIHFEYSLIDLKSYTDVPPILADLVNPKAPEKASSQAKGKN